MQVRDFSLIFDTLTQFEEALVQHRLTQAADDEDEAEEVQANGVGDDGEDYLLKDDENDIDLRYVLSCSQVTCATCVSYASIPTQGDTRHSRNHSFQLLQSCSHTLWCV